MFDRQMVIVFDTEWTSWKGYLESGWNQPGRYMEIVQIGAVALSVDDGFHEIDSFQVLIRPQRNPDLSDYFVDLTGITQAMVDDDGLGFPEALATFMDFAAPGPVQFACFGKDVETIKLNCGFYGIPMPAEFTNSVNLRKELLARNIIEDHWFSSDLPHRLGLPPVGRAHDALADSRALAAALRHVRAMLD